MSKNYKLERLQKGETFTTSEKGNSMVPLIHSGEEHTLSPATIEDVGGVPTRTFNFPTDFTEAPSFADNENAAVSHLFFLANWYHDRLQQLGFTEAAGNFQDVNATPDGVGGDRMLARLHVGNDNSFFSTPAADGTCCHRSRIRATT